MENRKQKEAEFHNKVRDKKLEVNIEEYKRLTSNRKFYSVTRKSEEFKRDFLIKNCFGKKVLDYCCGEGSTAIFLAENGANVIGVDISKVSIDIARKRAEEKRLTKKSNFIVMDAENLKFNNEYFDLVACFGVLHHLDIKKAYSELARILKPDGKVICSEPLLHNPFFQLYRKLTPHLRTKWEMEHILSRNDIKLAENYFGKVEKRFFHLAALLTVPFRDTPIFRFILSICEIIDSVILKMPFIKWWAWQIVFILSEPKKQNGGTQEKRN